MLRSFQKSNRLVLAAVILAVLSAPASLFAQSTGFKEGRFLLDLKAGWGLHFGGDVYNLYKDQNRILPIGPVTALNGDTSAAALQYISRQNAPEADLTSFGGQLTFEYALFDVLGIGLSATHQSYSAQNARLVPAAAEFGFLGTALLIPSLRGTFASLENVWPYLTTSANDFDRITAGDLNVAFHPFGGDGAIDLYFRGIAGYGQTQASRLDVIRYGIGAGFRFFFTDNIYVVTEADWVNNEIKGTVANGAGDTLFGGSSSGGDSFDGDLREINGRVGVGFAF